MALVLVIACANVANLLLARAIVNGHELRIRLALGASRWQVAREQFHESVLLAACAAAVGLVFALWASRALVAHMSTATAPVALDLPLDWRVFAFTVGVSCATAVLFGAAPVHLASRLAPLDALRRQGDGDLASQARTIVPRGLVVAQVAMSVVLVIAAGLLLRTFSSLATQHPGLDSDRVLVINMSGQRTAVEPTNRLAMYDQARQTASLVPGVAAAAISMLTPVGGVAFHPPLRVSGPSAQDNQPGQAFTNIISPGWFATMGIPITSGRDFTDGDRQGTRPVVIVNQAFSRIFTNGASPLGHTVRLSADLFPRAAPMEVVGMVGDAVYVSLYDPTPPTMYVPIAQFDLGPGSMASVNLQVRARSGPPAQLTRSIAAALEAVNPDLALRVRPLAEQIDASLIQERLVAALSSVFGALALLLAGLGLYGITTYAVARRRHEIGIRLALGARRRQILTLAVGQSAVVTAFGIVVGVAGAAAVTRYLERMLFRVTPLDLPTFIAVPLLFAAVACVAAYIPARAATRVDPVVALRLE